MAFTTINTRVPTSIGHIQVVTDDLDGTQTERGVIARIEVQDQDGATLHQWTGNLVPHLTQQLITAQIALLDYVRQKANEELLP